MIILKIVGSLVLALSALDLVAIALDDHPVKKDRVLSNLLDFITMVAWIMGLMVVNLLAIWTIIACPWWGWLIIVVADIFTMCFVTLD